MPDRTSLKSLNHQTHRRKVKFQNPVFRIQGFSGRLRTPSRLKSEVWQTTNLRYPGGIPPADKGQPTA